MDYKAYADKFGTVTFKSVEVAISQQPYLDVASSGHPVYKACGIDAKGFEYDIQWDVKDEFMDKFGQYNFPDDESDCCNWEIYEIRRTSLSPQQQFDVCEDISNKTASFRLTLNDIKYHMQFSMANKVLTSEELDVFAEIHRLLELTSSKMYDFKESVANRIGLVDDCS